MRKTLAIFLALMAISLGCFAAERVVKLKIVQTSDIHGSYYSTDLRSGVETSGSLARVHAFVQKKRELYGDNLILLENGDILQGQPTAYYYNYIDTVSPHLTAAMMNYMGYHAATVGNHDVETGRSVMDRWAGQCQCPMLGANIIDTATGEPHFKPYTIIQRDGVKIAVLGMITPAIPVWLSEHLWRGLRFDDMEETARRWVDIIRRREKPDVLIGLFHSGVEALTMMDRYRENASVEVARRVPGFDIVLAGHDHKPLRTKVCNVVGDSVLVMNPGAGGTKVVNIDVQFTLRKHKVVGKKISGVLSNTNNYGISEEFMQHFDPQLQQLKKFVSQKIGSMNETISIRDAFFGPSGFIDLIHSLQLAITGADISLTAPLACDITIPRGDLTVGDMFNLYVFENRLYTMRLSGREVHRMLEMSYDQWTAQMTSEEDHLIRFRPAGEWTGRKGCDLLENYLYNFDSAAGIRYTVDVSKPEGQRVHIESMADGTPFDENRFYRVAVNSYRGTGGGEFLTKGAGIPQEELASRILFSTDRDMRYYLMQYIEEQQSISPRPLNQWKFVPSEWTVPAARRDYRLMYGDTIQ